MLMFRQIYKKVILRLENNLPSYLTYHNAIHTKYVVKAAIHIGKQEGVSEHELMLLKIAALYHDTGFFVSRENHEAHGCKIASKELRQAGFNEHDLAQITGMIMATQIPQRPKTKLERILADADLEYLGTPQFDFFSQKLYDELRYIHPLLSPKEWNDIQLTFISAHSYHTDYCRKYKEPEKCKNLEKIKEKGNLLSQTT